MALILNGTDGLSDVDGTAATPAIRGTDTNTGIFFPAADTIAFAEGGVESARFDSAGNLGIGTTTPNGKLTSQTATSSTSAFTFATQLNNSFGSNESIAALGFHNRADVNSNGVGAAIALSGGGVSAGSGNMIFCIKGTGNIAAAVAPSDEKMRIDSSGNLLVGTTSQLFSGRFCIAAPLNTVNPISVQNTVTQGGGQSFMFMANSAGNKAGSIDHTGTTTVAYTTSSDYRMKENVQPMVGSLEKVLQLRPVTYNWKEDGSDGQGFIAHELQAVVPDCVTGEKDAVDAEGKPVYQGIDTSFLVATLTAAIQEFKAELDSVKAELAALKAPL